MVATQPKSRRLVFTPATEWDVFPLWHLWTDPLVREYLWDNRIISRAEATTVVEQYPGLSLWCLRFETHGGLIGFAGLAPASWADGIEPLIGLNPKHWGQGLATEALVALIAHAFGALDLAELIAGVDTPNAASHRLVQRCGFTPTGSTAGRVHPITTYRLPR